MNAVLLQSPASISGTNLRQVLLEALGGILVVAENAYYDSPIVKIPEAGRASGTGTNAGKQITQLVYSGTQPELESALQDASLQAHQIVGFQSMFNEYQGQDGNDAPIYAPTVTTAIENGTLQYLNKRYSDEAQTIEIPKNVNWFPIYAGQAPWVAA